MAEDDQHRRVEARTAIAGSGMLTEPDRIRTLEDDVERRKRAWRNAPAEGFSSVLSRTPAKEQERIGTYVPADERFHVDDDDDARARVEATPEREPSDAPATGDAPLPIAFDDAAERKPDAKPARASDAPALTKVGEPALDVAVDDGRVTRRPRPNEIKDPRIEALHRLLDAKTRKKGA
jgi:hypothetical protein